MSDNNEFLDILQAFEQMEATLRDLAPVLGTYRRSLHENGFTAAESLAMAMALQQTLLTQRPSEGRSWDGE